MRNLKKVLALVLAMAMSLSLAVTAGAAFNDQDKIVNTEAVDMCSALNIINGYTDGSFKPEGNVTRAEAAKMITIALNGGKEPTLSASATPTYTDIAGHWAAKYIEYCTSLGIVAGDGAGKFNPNGNVKAVELAKMLLIAIGYEADAEKFVGGNWDTNVNVVASQKDLYEELESIDPAVAATRDTAAQMVWNALNADMVDYEYKLSTDANGNLVSELKVKDLTGTTLLGKKYDTTEMVGMLTDVSYNTDKAEYTYTIGVDTVVDNKTVKAPTFKSAEDFSDLFGMNVEVIYTVDKNGNETVYGIVTEDSAVVAEDILGNIDSFAANDEMEISDVAYDTDAAVNGYWFVNGEVAKVADVTDMQGYEAFEFTAIDNNDNGKIDTIVIYPFTVAEVSFIGAKTFQAGTTYTTEEVNVYEGMAEDDYVIITNENNAVDGKTTFAKLDVASGDVTVDNNPDYTIGGEVYTVGTKANISDLELGNTLNVVAVNGIIFGTEKVAGTASLDEILFIDGAELSTSYGSSKVMAQAYDIEGNKTEIEVKSAENVDLTKITVAGSKALNGLWAFEIDDGKYKLTKITDDVVAGEDKGDFDLNVTTATAGKDKVAGYRVNDDAVIFVVDNEGDIYVKTGADVAAWSSIELKTEGASVDAYANKTDGVAYVELAAIYMGKDEIPDADSDAVYGYVTKVLGQTKEDDVKYNSYVIWTATGEQTIKVKNDNDFGAAKADFVKFENDKLTKLTAGNYNTITGIAGDSVYFAGGDEYVIAEDTQVIYINAKDVAGAEGSLKLATDLDGDTYNEKNVFVQKDASDKDASDGTDLLYVFVDVNNDIQKSVIK